MGGRRTQRARRTVTLTVRATSENVWASASGKLAIGGSERAYRLKGVTARFVERGDTAALRLELSRRALRATRRALDRLRLVRAALKLPVRDTAGNVTARKRPVKLER